MATYWLSMTDPVDPSWWEPLERLAATIADTDLPSVDPDDFAFAARVERPGLPVVHVYRHLHTRRCINVDVDGGLWRYVGTGRGNESYEAINDPGEAVARAEIERGNLLATHTRAKCEDAWLAAAGIAPDLRQRRTAV